MQARTVRTVEKKTASDSSPKRATRNALWPAWAPWAVLAIVGLVGGILLRAVLLGDRPVHHDEAIHATLSYQWWENPERSLYKYDPTYHGPLLYAVLHWIFPLFGVGIAQARLFPLVFGFGVLAAPLFLRKELGLRGAWLAILGLAISPLFVFYARFVAHDMPALFFAVGTLAAGLAAVRAAQEERWDQCRIATVAAALCLGLHFSVKATAFLYSFIFATFLCWAWAVDRFAAPLAFVKRLREDAPFRSHVSGLAVLAAGVFCVSYGTVQTTFFQNPAGFVDGLFGRVLNYWWNQHSIERVRGPVAYHLRSLLLHELPLVLLMTVPLCVRMASVRYGRVALIALGALFLATVPVSWGLEKTFGPAIFALMAKVKLKSSTDLFVYALCFVGGIIGSFQYLREGRRFAAFLVYWTFSSLAIYSYAGEKVPWLTVHVAFPVCLLAAYYAKSLWDAIASGAASPRIRRVAFASAVFVAFWQLRTAYLVTYISGGTPNDLLSQVHNTKDVRFVMDWMERISYETGERPEKLSFAVVGQPVWAFYFHIIERGFKHFALDAKSVDGTQRFVILDENNQKELGSKLLAQGYRETKLIHSGWWVPEHASVTWLQWLDYAVTHRAPTASGTTPMWVYFKPLDLVSRDLADKPRR